MQLTMDVCVELDRCSSARSQSIIDPSGIGFPSLMVIGTIGLVTDELQAADSAAQTNEIVLQPDQIKLEPVDHAVPTGEWIPHRNS